MALFTAQHREMLAAVSSATGGLESRLSELEAESVANRTVKASISAGISAAISGEASTAEERAFERMRQAAKGSLLSDRLRLFFHFKLLLWPLLSCASVAPEVLR